PLVVDGIAVVNLLVEIVSAAQPVIGFIGGGVARGLIAFSAHQLARKSIAVVGVIDCSAFLSAGVARANANAPIASRRPRWRSDTAKVRSALSRWLVLPRCEISLRMWGGR